MNRKRSELVVGIFLFVGLCLLAGMILKFGSFGDAFRPKYTIVLRYPSAGGLLKGSEVKFSGVTIGKVSKPPSPNNDRTGAIIELSIFEDFPVPKGSQISIETSGFLGDSFVGIRPPTTATDQYYDDGEIVEGTPAGGLSALADSAGDLSEAGKEVVDDMRQALVELNSALTKLDSSILGEENLALFNETVIELSDAIKGLNSDVLGDENTENLRAALNNFRETSEKLVETSENLAASSSKVAPILDSAQSAVDKADDAVASINQAARTADAAMKKAVDGPGLLSALINDSELRADFEALVANLRNNGILRYRDDADEEDQPRRGILRRNR